MLKKLLGPPRKRSLTTLGVALVCTLIIVAAAAGRSQATTVSYASGPSVASKSCAPGYVDANLSWGEKCLKAGEFCKIGNPAYHAYGFDCLPDGRLVDDAQPVVTTTTMPTATTTASTPTVTTVAPSPKVVVGRTVLLRRRTRLHACTRGALPDRRCSPGAYSSGLTKAVICASTFRTGAIRNVPQSEKNAVEREYGMAAKSYGRTIEIDHIISLELGGSNDIANLFPEPGSGKANYHIKDKLENKLHTLVCGGKITLATARRGIATNWETLYRTVFGANP
jgi:hypothetical protein